MAERKRQRKDRGVSTQKNTPLSAQVELPLGLDGRDLSEQRESVRELSWARFGRMARNMATQIKRAYRPDAVVGVAHGGVFVGGVVAGALGAEFFPVRISRRSRDHGERRSKPRLLGTIPTELKGRRVLVVDDVASSGDTMELAKSLLSRVRAKETRTASLIARPGRYTPDWASLITPELFVFPWDYDNLRDYEPARALDPAIAPAKKKTKAPKRHRRQRR